MDIMWELVKLADDLDRAGDEEAVKKIDGLITKAAEKKKEKSEGDLSPVLKMRCRKLDDDDGSYEVVVFAPSGVSPYDPIVHSYVQKYGPFGEGANLDYQEMLASSIPHEPNTFKYRLRGPAKLSGEAPSIIGSKAADALLKIANDLDAAGEFDLANEIDVILGVGR